MSEVPGAVRCQGGFSLSFREDHLGLSFIRKDYFVKSHIKIEMFDGAELCNVEGKLRKQGYRLVHKNNENDLLPGEFIKEKFFSTIDSPEAKPKWYLSWRV